MDAMEKLVELLKTNACPAPFMCDPVCRYYGYGDCFPYRFADHLITNGVTVQEWISVKDRLPEQPPNIVDEKGRSWFTPDIDCIVYDGKSVFAAHYCFQNKFFWYADTMHPLKNITHWMPLPPTPKEDKDK